MFWIKRSWQYRRRVLKELMSIEAIIMPVSVAAFAYLILALQLLSGIPPFYRKFSLDSEVELRQILPSIFLLMFCLMLFGATNMRIFFGAFGAVALWSGLRIRSILRKDKQGIRDWIVHPVTLRWPMLAFDLWTIGLSAAMYLLYFL